MRERPIDELLDLTTEVYWWKPMAAWSRALHLRTYCDCGVALRGRTLDLGCGDGGWARLLHEVGLLPERPYGVDISAVELEKAQRSDAHASLISADAGRLPFATDTFTGIVCSGVLASMPDNPVRALEEIQRVLEPGGILLVTVPTDEFNAVLLWPRILRRLSPALAREYVRRLMRRLPHFNVHSVDGWRGLLAANGMQVLETRLFLTRREGHVWSILALQAVRVIAVLRLLRSRTVARIARRVVKYALRRLMTPASDVRGTAGYVFFAARMGGGGGTAAVESAARGAAVRAGSGGA